MTQIPCHRCLLFTEQKKLVGYLTSFVPSKWDYYEMRIYLCPDCVKDWVGYYDSLHMEDLRIGQDNDDNTLYNPKTMSHIHMLIFKDWFLSTKNNPSSIEEMHRKTKRKRQP